MNTKPINHGGPAFPMPSGPEPRVDSTTHYNEGMTLRAYYAGQALMGWAAGRNHSMRESDPDKVATACVAYADALIRKLEAKP